jgi:hypothetical protein
VRLSEAEFSATFKPPMQRLPPEQVPPFDFWDYFDRIPEADFAGFDCSQGSVTYVYGDADGRFEHVLVNSDEPEVFMVLVLDPARNTVLGHHLLDLPTQYGLREAPAG